jgi:hypothetical protein
MHSNEKEEIARAIQNGSYFSAMNNTKWLKLVTSFGDGMRARVKLITESDLDSWHVMTLAACNRYLDGPSYGPVPFLEIEWIDISICHDNPRFSDAMNAIRDLKLPCASIDDIVRVFGHVAPGTVGIYPAEEVETLHPLSAAPLT